MNAARFLSLLLTLFLIVDPVGCLPLFAAITRARGASERRAMVRRAVWVAFAVLAAFALAGNWVLERLGIGLPAVRIAGGILLFIIGLEMLYGRVSRTETTAPEEQEAAEKEDISITPLAIPLLAGPGSITAVILLADSGPGWGDVGWLVVALALVMAASLALLSTTRCCAAWDRSASA